MIIIYNNMVLATRPPRPSDHAFLIFTERVFSGKT